ncbi:MAG: hypothetical protein GY870_11755 [archaeon]|nr:hypothetical protein [archaeon]
MPSNKFCVYCGSEVKDSDKFCIFCGKPRLSNLSKDTKKPKKEKKPEKQPEPEPEIEPEPVEEEVTEEVVEEEISKKDEKKKEKISLAEAKSLPDDVKEQIDLYIQSTDIKFNKKVLSDKLTEILKSTRDSRYETDFDFKTKVNVKLEAIKTLIAELKENEAEIKLNMDDVFIVKKLNTSVDTKENQLRNLTKEYRLKKMNKETFEQLRDKYKEETINSESELAELMMGIKLWIQEIKTERAEMTGERKLNKGRLSSKEITQEEFKKTDNDFKLKLEKLAAKIKTLESLIKKK